MARSGGGGSASGGGGSAVHGEGQGVPRLRVQTEGQASGAGACGKQTGVRGCGAGLGAMPPHSSLTGRPRANLCC